VTQRLGGKVFVRKTAIPKEEQLTAAEAEQGHLPIEPLRLGERVLLCGALESVGHRLGALERQVDPILDALGARGDKTGSPRAGCTEIGWTEPRRGSRARGQAGGSEHA